MISYKIIIAYDGTDYAGWIQQKDQPSIVGTLEDSFKQAFNHSVTILGASKTDAGVHAMGQVARASTDLDIDADKLIWVWNNALPESISIISIKPDQNFHPHHDVVEKTYHYYISTKRPLPFNARYVTQASSFDLELFKSAIALFEGTHDFTAFYTGDDRQDTVRTLKKIDLSYSERYDAYLVTIIGQKFLRHMIRRMIGAALAVVSRKTMDLDAITHALETKEVNHELPTAPAKGLMLYEIKYGKDND